MYIVIQKGLFMLSWNRICSPWAKLIIAPWLIIIMAITDVRDCWTMYWAEIARGERYSEVKPFRLSGLPRLVVHDAHFTGYSFYLSAEVRFKSNGGIIEQGACYSSTKRIPTVDDQKTLARETRNYDYSFLEVEVTDLLPNTHYYIRPYVTTEEGTGYGPVVEFTTEPGTEPIINQFSLYSYDDTSVELYASFYTNDYQITNYGYSYGIYSQETGTVKDEQMIEVPFGDDYGQELSKNRYRTASRNALCFPCLCEKWSRDHLQWLPDR